MDVDDILLKEEQKVEANPSSDSTNSYDQNDEEKRETWSNYVQSFLTVLGGIIGLGNIWRFPYITYAYGGGAFLIPYVTFVVLCGFPMFFTEMALGQNRRRGAIKIWDIAPIMRGIGYGCTLMACYCDIYYIMVMAWAIFYFVHSLTTSELPWMHCENWWNTPNCSTYQAFINTSMARNNSESYNLSLTSKVLPTEEFWKEYVLRKSAGLHDMGSLENWQMLLCLIVSWILIYFCIFKGVKSVGKVVYFTATFPYLILAILLVQACTLDGAMNGIFFYLRPNVTMLRNPTVWVQAGSQVCFSYAICFTIIVTLGSYNTYHMDCYRHSIVLAASCSITSFIAGFAVFGMLGHMAKVMDKKVEDVVDKGPGLAFITYPLGLSLLQLPQLFNALFFLMIIVIAIDSQFTAMEGLLTPFFDQWKKAKENKELFTAVACFLLFLIGIVFVTNGGVYVFEMFNNYAVSGIALLWLVLMESIAIAWIYGTDNFYEDINDMIGYYPSIYVKICIRFATPAMTTLVMLYFFAKYTPLTVEGYTFPPWANGIGWILCMSSFLCVPVYAIYNVWSNEGTLKQRILKGMKPLKSKKHDTNEAGINNELKFFPK